MLHWLNLLVHAVRRPMTADEIVRAKAKARLAQQAGFFSASGSGSRPAMPSRLSAGASKPALPPSNLPSRTGKPSPTAANPLPAAAAATSGPSGGSTSGHPASGGLHAQKGWPGHTAVPGAHMQPARPGSGLTPAAPAGTAGPQVGTHLPAAGPAHLQQPVTASGWGSGADAASLGGAMGHLHTAPGGFQQQLPSPLGPSQLRKMQMVAADQEFLKQQHRLYGFRRAWAGQVCLCPCQLCCARCFTCETYQEAFSYLKHPAGEERRRRAPPRSRGAGGATVVVLGEYRLPCAAFPFKYNVMGFVQARQLLDLDLGPRDCSIQAQLGLHLILCSHQLEPGTAQAFH